MKMKIKNVMIFMIVAFMFAMTVNALCERAAWDCPECGKTGNTGKFCGGCGHPAVEIVEQRENVADGTNKTDRTIAVGDIITFGRYEQDNNLENGSEEIEWIVLDYDKTGNNALLLSRYGLDAKPYNTVNKSITWEECTIRKWLNEDFFNTAFKRMEQSAVLTIEVDNSPSQGYGKWNTNGGCNTQDRVFLLSCTEANRYLDVTLVDGNNLNSRVEPTAYAIDHGAFTINNYFTKDGNASGWWWLRSPGYDLQSAADVHISGSLSNRSVNSASGVIRPALWISLESDIF